MSDYDKFEKLDTNGKLNQVFKKLLKLERKQSEILSKTEAIEKLFTYQTPAVDTFSTPAESELEPQIEDHIDVGPPLKDTLVKSGVDFELVTYEGGGLTITPKKFLGDLWGNINMLLKAENYEWVRDGRNSHWAFQGTGKKTPAAKPKPSGGAAIPILEVGTYVTVEGNLLDDPVQRDVDTTRGPTSVTNFRIKLDDGQTVKVGLWEDKADKAMDLVAGVRVHLTSMKVKEPYDGVPQLSSAKYTKVSEVPSR